MDKLPDRYLIRLCNKEARRYKDCHNDLPTLYLREIVETAVQNAIGDVTAIVTAPVWKRRDMKCLKNAAQLGNDIEWLDRNGYNGKYIVLVVEDD